MQLINATKLQAGDTLAVQPDGREVLVVVVKGTFTIPETPDQDPALAKDQVLLVMTDVFTGEPGFSAPLYEMDFAMRKPRCDVLLNGSAYAPSGNPTDRVAVSLRVGSLTKSFDVVGKRVWKSGVLDPTPTPPEPFEKMPISYNNAFGGVDKAQEDPAKWRWYLLNHAGVGYHEYTSGRFIDGKPLPNTEERGSEISNPKGSYRPMALGPVGRAWQPRVKLAGTYDQKWIDTTFPFLPDDFQDAYHQAAPVDQQTDYLQGGEEVELTNLTPHGRIAFTLPEMPVPFELFYRNGERKYVSGVIDTLLLEPDARRFTMCSRMSMPLRRNLDEIRSVIAGPMPTGWYTGEGLQRSPTGKPRFKSLAHLGRQAAEE
jgi:hypothetical protein